MTDKARWNPQIHHRRSVRLAGYDYTQAGMYFITVCTHNRQTLFGEIVDREMILNEYGQVVAACWQRLPRHFPNITLAEWVIMPNHIHGIVVITDRQETALPPGTHNGPRPGSIGALVQNFKSVAARKINTMRQTPGTAVWQRNYWEHIVRNEQAYEQIGRYILNNPAQWDTDSLRPTFGRKNEGQEKNDEIRSGDTLTTTRRAD